MKILNVNLRDVYPINYLLIWLNKTCYMHAYMLVQTTTFCTLETRCNIVMPQTKCWTYKISLFNAQMAHWLILFQFFLMVTQYSYRTTLALARKQPWKTATIEEGNTETLQIIPTSPKLWLPTSFSLLLQPKWVRNPYNSH